MKISGIVLNGVIVLDDSVQLPEGTRVLVSAAPPGIRLKSAQKRVEFPLVPSANPGTVHLTNERIGEILDDEDAANFLT